MCSPNPPSRCVSIFTDGEFGFYLVPNLHASLPPFLLRTEWEL